MIMKQYSKQCSVFHRVGNWLGKGFPYALTTLILSLQVQALASSVIGCRSFAILSRRTRLGPRFFRHPLFIRHLGRPSTGSRTNPSTTTLPSDMATARGNEANFLSTGIDIDVDKEDSCKGKEKSFGLYIHIPYCRQRCRYCDFAIVPIGANMNNVDLGEETRTRDDFDRHDLQQRRREQGFSEMNDRYVAAIVTELKKIKLQNTDQRNIHKKLPLRSIYFGGGTPSLAPIESIGEILYHACGRDNPEAPFRLLQQQPSEEILDGVKKSFDVFPTTEITMEMDPGTFDQDYLSALRTLGINRVSLGVQSFDDNLLHAMGRTHRRADVLQAVHDIAFVFGRDINYSIDLISGCPGLTPAKWVETLQEATAGVENRKRKDIDTSFNFTFATKNDDRSLLLSSLPPPSHISVYDLQIEEGTVFGKWAAKAKEEAMAKRGKAELSDEISVDEEDEDASRQFSVTLKLDRNGEVSGPVTRGSYHKDKSEQQQRRLHLPSEDECAFMYKYAAGYLRAKNYEHYEVSSYAAFCDPVESKRFESDEGDWTQHSRPESKRSRHNQIYWEYDGQWFAVGLGATSFIDQELVARPKEMSNYIDWVNKGVGLTTSAAVKNFGDEEDTDKKNDFLTDLLLKRLRTADGLDLSWLEAKFGSETVKDVLRGAKLGLELGMAIHTDENVLRLTDPDGLLYSNFIISSIYAELGYTL